MNEDLATVLGAPKLVTGADGHQYLMAPMSPRDFAEHGAYLKSLCDAETQSPLAAIAADLKHLPAEFQGEAIRAAVAMKAGGKKTEPSREAILAKSSELVGVRHQFWIAARKNHTGLTLAAVANIVSDANIFDILAASLEVNGQPATGDDDPK